MGYTVKYQGHWFGPKISLYEFKKNGEYVTDFDIPATYEHNGKKYKITKIGDYVFYSNSLLMSVTIPNTVTEIGDHAFYLNESLINITIPDSVTKIGNYAFAYCSFKNMIIPKTVTQIGENAFYCVSHIEYYGSAKDPKSFLFFNGKWGAKAMN